MSMDRPVSPTNTEWNTFQVVANPNYVNIQTAKPTRNDFLKTVAEDEESDYSEEDLRNARLPVPMPPMDRRSYASSSSSSRSTSTASSRRSSHSSVPLPKSPKNDSVFDSISMVHANPIQMTHVPQGLPTNPYQAQGIPVMPNMMPRIPETQEHDNESQAYSHAQEPMFSQDPPEDKLPKQVPESPSRQRALEMTEQEIWVEKEGLLSEISIMEKKGIVKLARPLSMDDSLEEIQFQQDRANSVQNAVEMVEYGKSGIQLMSRMMEFAFKSMGLKLMDGFSNQFKDMKRYDRPLTKMQRKQWRGQYFTPETELAILVLGSVFITILNNNGLGLMGSMMSNMFTSGDSSKPEKAAAEVPPLARPVPVQTSGNVPFAKADTPSAAVRPPPAPEARPTQYADNRPTQYADNRPAQANIPSMPMMKRPNSAAPPAANVPVVPSGPPRPIPMGSVGAEVAEMMPKTKTVTVGSMGPTKRGPSKKNAEPPLQL